MYVTNLAPINILTYLVWVLSASINMPIMLTLKSYKCMVATLLKMPLLTSYQSWLKKQEALRLKGSLMEGISQ